MKSFEYTITDPVGIHARPAGILVREVKKGQVIMTFDRAKIAKANHPDCVVVLLTNSDDYDGVVCG